MPFHNSREGLLILPCGKDPFLYPFAGFFSDRSFGIQVKAAEKFLRNVVQETKGLKRADFDKEVKNLLGEDDGFKRDRVGNIVEPDRYATGHMTTYYEVMCIQWCAAENGNAF